VRAFNWAEQYQIPVILLTDKYLLENHSSVKPFDLDCIKIERAFIITGSYAGKKEYKRYRITETGASPRAIPPTAGVIVRTNANEHDEAEYTTDDPEMTTRMIERRLRKLCHLAEELEKEDSGCIKLYGPFEGAGHDSVLGVH